MIDTVIQKYRTLRENLMSNCMVLVDVWFLVCEKYRALRENLTLNI
jgi:hypothetical protein